ncbi:MAG: hypothetical protein NT149_00345 [Candidatus Gottesmanbacteria bacterium]|nr:hypothetical protein [Candidatus Gottesmanbacteria bacterium]
MNKQTLITSALIIIIVGLLAFIAIGSKGKTTSSVHPQTAVPVFFYGNTCPHCAEVETWMKDNNVGEKVTITKKEVYDNQQNADEMILAAKSCGLPTDSIGVPFLYAEGKCFIGTPDVMNYLSAKAGIK